MFENAIERGEWYALASAAARQGLPHPVIEYQWEKDYQVFILIKMSRGTEIQAPTPALLVDFVST